MLTFILSAIIVFVIFGCVSQTKNLKFAAMAMFVITIRIIVFLAIFGILSLFVYGFICLLLTLV